MVDYQEHLREVVLITLGGLFGWTLGKLPERWVYVVIAVAIILVIISLKG